MRIRSIETFTTRTVSIVRVRTDDGAEGYGQIAPFNADISATVLHRQIAHHALGADAMDRDELADRCIDRNHKFPWSYVCREASCEIDKTISVENATNKVECPEACVRRATCEQVGLGAVWFASREVC